METLKSILVLTIITAATIVITGCSSCGSEDTLCLGNMFQTNTTGGGGGGGGGGGLIEFPVSVCQPYFPTPYLTTASGERIQFRSANPAANFYGGYPTVQLFASEGVIQAFEGAATLMLKATRFETFVNTAQPFCLKGTVTAQRPPLTGIDNFHVGINRFSSEINSSPTEAVVYWNGTKFNLWLNDSTISDGQNSAFVNVLISVNIN